MKNLYSFLFLTLILCLHAACDKENLQPEPPDISVVSQFVYDGLSAYYYWNEEMIDRMPSAGDTDPVKYFNSLLHGTDTEHGWSWITDDVNELLAGFSGESLSFGYDLDFILGEDGAAYARVRYVHAGTPAEKAGIRRLDLIGKLNGQAIMTEQRGEYTYISSQSLNLLYGNNPVTFSTYRISGDRIIPAQEVKVTPDNSRKDPVLCDSVYAISGKKIGYLFYTDFVDNFNDHLYKVFSRFKQEGVTDLVLDLRYNRGGAVSSAIYLASLIAPEAAVRDRSPFVVMEFNNTLNTIFDRWYNDAKPEDKYMYDRKDYLGSYDGKYPDPLGANLNLNRVYIIATDNSYSASELTIFCLSPYMDVVHIGGRTGGKYTASWTVHAYDPLRDGSNSARANTLYEEDDLSPAEREELKNWAMQPIVAVYADKDSRNFSTPGYLEPDYLLQEGFNNVAYWTPLGDTKDVFLGQALSLISGDNSYLPVPPQSMRHAQAAGREIVNPRNTSVPAVMDNMKLTPEDFRKLRELRRRN
ncbi:MAG: hypothetical protein LBH72_06565 [Proteiniphilum sp.]|jgi:C-terminal processing protease CtpA/Prc|nr:hypothetical protein [Proteiniphilum sp.]